MRTPFDDVPSRDELRVDRIDVAPTSLMYWGDEPDATPGILIYTSRFIQVGQMWVPGKDPRYLESGTKHLQVMRIEHIYSENGWTVDDHDPYHTILSPVEYREVDLPVTGIWRTAENDPAKGMSHHTPDPDVDLHLDWLEGR
jgi:hypothetical protein